MLWNREIPKKCMTAVYKLYHKSSQIKIPKHGPLQREIEEKFLQWV
jgi:hypothetical protein